MLSAFITRHFLPHSFAATATKFYIPLADKFFSEHQAGSKNINTDKSPFFIGINGCQGSGKSTLSKFLAEYLQHKYNLSVVVLSLDDFYLSKAKRQLLAETIHPLFQTRGVPGTHDIKRLKEVLLGLKKINEDNLVINLPRFDKAQDDVIPLSDKVTSKVDIVLFEGWCWGVCAQGIDTLNMPINKLEEIKDSKAIWRSEVNKILRQDYQPLYGLMDMWLMLKAPNFDNVYQWRLEQEEKLRKTIDNKKRCDGLMSFSEIDEFIQFFQRLTIHSLNSLPSKVDILFELADNRDIIACKGLT